MIVPIICIAEDMGKHTVRDFLSKNLAPELRSTFSKPKRHGSCVRTCKDPTVAGPTMQIPIWNPMFTRNFALLSRILTVAHVMLGAGWVRVPLFPLSTGSRTPPSILRP